MPGLAIMLDLLQHVMPTLFDNSSNRVPFVLQGQLLKGCENASFIILYKSSVSLFINRGELCCYCYLCFHLCQERIRREGLEGER